MLTKSNFTCTCGCGKNLIKEEVIKLCNQIATKVGLPLTINSGYRCESKNSSIKGASSTSQHLYGKAADITCTNLTKLKEVCQSLWADKTIGGLGEYSTFVHVDIGNHRKWSGK